MTTADILRQAKNVLLVRGWTQGTFQNTRNEVCLIGAAIVVGEGILKYAAVLERVLQRDGFRASPGQSPIAEWNDQLGRRPEDILDVLDRAIALADADAAQPATDPVEVLA